MTKQTRASAQRFPLHGWIGVVLVLVFWAINWSFTGLRTHWAFTPLWLGYCLTVDGLVFWRKGTSLMTRSWQAYLALFLVSILGWWIFELFNIRLQNWSYIGAENFTRFEYGVLASLSFSTVVPAVFGTAELIGSAEWLRDLKPGFRISTMWPNSLIFFIAGWVSLGLMLVWPRYFFPLLWLSVFFILEPINLWLGNRTLAAKVDQGDWRPVIALWLGALVCGFFWEMWNFYSFPKWVYDVPFVDFLHIFEMPILGYGGYMPFAMELYAMYHLLAGFTGRKFGWKYIALVD